MHMSNVLPLFSTASSITWLDVVLPPSLLALSLSLYQLSTESRSSRPIHIYQTTSSHARLLPKDSSHRFSYPTVNIGVDLTALEADQLNLSRWFAYDRWALLTMWPQGYADTTSVSQERSIEKRLRKLLMGRGYQHDRIKRIYTTSMPAYLGFQGINPLVVHYCYELSGAESRLEMCLVILEVHNTFGERHQYLLQVGKGQDNLSKEQKKRGFFQWTFPRAFHVSPFNDRSGFYQVILKDPLRQRTDSFTDCTLNPNMYIKITLLTIERQEKLVASLKGSGRPLTRQTILNTIFTFPISLFLTSVRILYQASVIHYKKRLDVYLRPEPFTADGLVSNNPVSSEAAPGSIQWQPRAWTDKIIEKLLVRQLTAQGLTVHLEWPESARNTIYPSKTGSQVPKLTITVGSPTFFSNIFLFPSIDTGLQMSKQEGHGLVSDEELLCERMRSSKRARYLDPFQLKLRRRYYQWLGASQDTAEKGQNHFEASLSSTFLLIYLCSMDILTYLIFKVTRARFIKGTSPWEILTRVEEMQ